MTTDVNNPVAEPSAAAPVAAPATPAAPTFDPSDQHTWSPEQREQWNKDGKIPVVEPKKGQEAAPATKEKDSEGQPKSAAEPETAPKQERKERKPGEKLSADERIAELVAENKRLKEERERSRESTPKSTTKEPAKEAAKPVEAPKRPNAITWTGTPEEFDAAMDAYENHLRKIVAADALNQHFQREQAQKLQGNLDEARKRYADADTRIFPVSEALGDPQIPAAVRGMIEDSPVFVDLLYTLGADGKLAEFVNTAKTNPGKAIRELVVLEGLVQEELGRSKSSAAPAKSEASSEEKPPAEPKPRAPKPPSEVGARGTAAEDQLVAAARANDFSAFEAEQNRRAQARAGKSA